MTIFINGKQKRIRRPPSIDGIDAYEFILRNADSIWLHQNETWELLGESGTAEQVAPAGCRSRVPAEQWCCGTQEVRP